VLVALVGSGEEHDKAYTSFTALAQRNPRVKARKRRLRCDALRSRTAHAPCACAHRVCLRVRCADAACARQVVSFATEGNARSIADTLQRILLD
jgi:hypothetical protein